jgi:hypothetical protein
MSVELHGQAIREGLDSDLEWSEREQALFEQARLLARRIDELETAVDEHGVLVPGPKGDLRLNAAVSEVRQCHAQLTRTLSMIDIPGEAAGSSLHGLKAARARWGVENGAA